MSPDSQSGSQPARPIGRGPRWSKREFHGWTITLTRVHAQNISKSDISSTRRCGAGSSIHPGSDPRLTGSKWPGSRPGRLTTSTCSGLPWCMKSKMSSIEREPGLRPIQHRSRAVRFCGAGAIGTPSSSSASHVGVKRAVLIAGLHDAPCHVLLSSGIGLAGQSVDWATRARGSSWLEGRDFKGHL